MAKTLADVIQEDQAQGAWTREDWSRLGRGLLTREQEQDILADGYEAMVA